MHMLVLVLVVVVMVGPTLSHQRHDRVDAFLGAPITTFTSVTLLYVHTVAVRYKKSVIVHLGDRRIQPRGWDESYSELRALSRLRQDRPNREPRFRQDRPNREFGYG